MPKRKRSDASDCSDDSFPTLLELASYEFAKGLWKCVIRQTALPGDSSKFDETFIEHCKDLVMEKLREYSGTTTVARCQSTIAAQVNRLMGEMVNEFSSLALSLSYFNRMFTFTFLANLSSFISLMFALSTVS